MSQVYDALNEEKLVESIVPQAVTATTSGYVVNGTNARYIVHNIAIGAITTMTSSDYLTASISEADAITDGTTLSNGTTLPTANILGAEYCTGAGYVANFPKVTWASPYKINDSTAFASGSTLRLVTLKNKTYQQLVLTKTGSFSALVSATAKICGYGVVPAV